MRNSGPSANLGMSRSAAWLRIALQVPPHDDPHWLLELAYVEVRAGGGDTVFRVRDQGIGIPPEELGDLFESFHRASNVGAIQGTGLGLAIVKSAVDVHGGTIHVESRLGAGTTFVVRIPPARQAQALRPALPEADPALPS